MGFSRQEYWSGVPLPSLRKTSISALLTMLKLLTMWITNKQTKKLENSSRDGNSRPPDCPLGNLYVSQEATVRTGHGTTDWLQIGKRVHQGCIFSPCLFNLYEEYIMRNSGLDEAQAGIKSAGRNVSSDMQIT